MRNHTHAEDEKTGQCEKEESDFHINFVFLCKVLCKDRNILQNAFG
ncbi:hypothetical protein KL86DYS1_10983 [uncultured Dysgonomonas sp.]|uniref:Uncharacterized protein n=1 Tax=uncultured Dysgonomonas sp. TaxID=206096 RepID=A0A212J380_9BACT|nr:hypothetical protein KL86DYS1_10983 [uncultured Dysgonomonas sp.]